MSVQSMKKKMKKKIKMIKNKIKLKKMCRVLVGVGWVVVFFLPRL